MGKMEVRLKPFLFGVCACLNFGIPLTLLFSLNALFFDWLTYFKADRGLTSAVQATCIGVTLGAGLLAGVLERKLGARRSLLLGSCLSSAGLFAGSYAPSLPLLILFVGVVTGAGFCLLHLSTISTALRRFPDKAGFMSSAMTAMGGLFHLATPLLYRLLAEEYMWRGSLLMASAIALHTAIFGLLLTSPVLQPTSALQGTPLTGNEVQCTSGDVVYDAKGTVTFNIQETSLEAEEQKKRKNVKDIEQIQNVRTNSVTHIDLSAVRPHERVVKVKDCDNGDSHQFSTEELREKTKITQDQVLLEDKQSECLGQTSSCQSNNAPCTGGQNGDSEELQALTTQQNPGEKWVKRSKNSNTGEYNKRYKKITKILTPLYVCVLVNVMVTLSAIFSFILLVLDLASDRGWTIQGGILLNFIFMLSSLIARVLVGVVSLHARVRNTALLIGGGMIGSAGLGLVGQVHRFPLVGIFYSCMGIGYGMMVGMFPPAVLDITGPRVYPLTLGLLCTVEGVMDTGLGILTGVLVDASWSYSLLSLVYGVLSLGCTISLLVVFLSRR